MSTSVAVEHRRVAEGAAFSIILALGFSHFLNDTMQSLVPALYPDRKSTRLNSSHVRISYAVFCLKKKKKNQLTFSTEAIGNARAGQSAANLEHVSDLPHKVRNYIAAHPPIETVWLRSSSFSSTLV